MAVPYTFGTATAAIPLSNLDSNFATPITLGNTAIQLGNTVTTLNNMTLANVTISSVGTAIPNNLLANSSVTLGNTSVSLGSTATSLGNLTTANVTVTNYIETLNAWQQQHCSDHLACDGHCADLYPYRKLHVHHAYSGSRQVIHFDSQHGCRLVHRYVYQCEVA